MSENKLKPYRITGTRHRFADVSGVADFFAQNFESWEECPQVVRAYLPGQERSLDALDLRNLRDAYDRRMIRPRGSAQEPISNQSEEAQHVQPPVEEAQFAIVELMGHLQLGGRISEVRYGGADMIRLDIPTADGSFATQYLGGSAVYRITFCDETLARSVSKTDILPVAEINVFRQLEKAGYLVSKPVETPAITAPDQQEGDPFENE